MIDIDQNSTLAYALAGLATLGTWGYAQWRKHIANKQGDSRVDAESDLIKRLQQVVESQEKRIDVLTDRLDKMAEARNVALVENARLKTIVEHFTKEVEGYEDRIQELKQDVARMEGMEEELHALRLKVEKL